MFGYDRQEQRHNRVQYMCVFVCVYRVGGMMCVCVCRKYQSIFIGLFLFLFLIILLQCNDGVISFTLFSLFLCRSGVERENINEEFIFIGLVLVSGYFIAMQ